ncbi:MAG: hypothetical protein VYE16_01705, partial [Cyanobacteriota bacterium]|nr:hypothetical protein [Cyanobacteriota bacterium]
QCKLQLTFIERRLQDIMPRPFCDLEQPVYVKKPGLSTSTFGSKFLFLALMVIKASEPWLHLQCLNPLGVSIVTSL